MLLENLDQSNVDCTYVIADPSRTTTTKVRVLAGQHYAARQQVIRIDYEGGSAIDADIHTRILNNLRSAADDADAIIVSDYNYGVADADLYSLAREIARERSIPLLIDSRFRLADYPGATTATPNQDEVEQMLGKDFTDEECAALREKLGYDPCW